MATEMNSIEQNNFNYTDGHENNIMGSSTNTNRRGRHPATHPRSNLFINAGSPHFEGVRKQTIQENATTKFRAILGDMMDYPVLEGHEVKVKFTIDGCDGSVSKIQITDDCYEFKGLLKEGKDNPLNFAYVSNDHSNDNKESTYGKGWKSSGIIVSDIMTLITRTFNEQGEAFYLDINCDFNKMCKTENSGKSFNPPYQPLTYEEYVERHGNDNGSTIIYTNIRSQFKNIPRVEIKQTIESLYPSHLQKINLYINDEEIELELPILSKDYFDQHKNDERMLSGKATIHLKPGVNSNLFQAVCKMDFGDKTKYGEYDSGNTLCMKNIGKRNNYDDKIRSLGPGVIVLWDIPMYNYRYCNIVRDEAIRNNHRANQSLVISHNQRVYENGITANKGGDNHGQDTVMFFDYSPKIMTGLLGLSSSKEIKSSDYDSLSSCIKFLGRILSRFVAHCKKENKPIVEDIKKAEEAHVNLAEWRDMEPEQKEQAMEEVRNAEEARVNLAEWRDMEPEQKEQTMEEIRNAEEAHVNLAEWREMNEEQRKQAMENAEYSDVQMTQEQKRDAIISAINERISSVEGDELNELYTKFCT